MDGVNAILNYAYGVYSILGVSLYVFVVLLISVVCGISKSYQLDEFCKVYARVSILLSLAFVVIVSIINTISFILE